MFHFFPKIMSVQLLKTNFQEHSEALIMLPSLIERGDMNFAQTADVICRQRSAQTQN